MNAKLFFSLTVLLALAPAAGAQTNAAGPDALPAFPQEGQRGTAIPVPLIRPRGSLPTNRVVTTPAFPTLPGTQATPTSPLAAPELAPAGQPGGIPNPNVAGALGNAPTTPARPEPEPATYTYHFDNVPVEQLLGIYADLIGRTPFRANAGTMAVPPQTFLTLKTQSPLTRSEAILALETILGMNGITVVPIGEKFFKVVTEQSAPQVGGLISSNVSTNLPDAGRFITEIVQLKYADPQQVVDALGKFAKSQNSIIFIPSTQSLILRDYTENVKRMLEMVEKIDVTSPLIVKPRVIPIKYALASDISSALSQLGAQGGTSVGRSSSGANFSGGGGGGGANRTGTSGGVGGQQGAYGQSTQQGLSSGAGGARSNFANNLGRIVAGAGGGGAGGAGGFSLFGQTKIIADERTNSLLVFANDEDMKMIQEIIDKLDVVLAQVLIEAIILEVSLTDSRQTGVSFLANKQTSGRFSGAGGANNLSSGASGFLSSGSASGSNTTSTLGSSTLPNLPGGFSYFGKWGNDLDVVLEAVASDARVNVLSRPRIQTSHAVEAELFIGSTVPYVTGTYNNGYGGGPSSQYTEKEVGIRLRVLPLINPEGLVVMDIDQEIEQLGAPVAIPGAGNVPTTTKRDAGAKVAVKSGETIILGGFISATRQKGNAGVPFLKDIPLLGNLFRSSSIDNTRTELIVMMRPTVLKTPEIAAIVAREERDKMAGVKQAEVEIRRDEDERNAVAQRLLEKEEAREASHNKNVKTVKPPETKPADILDGGTPENK